MSKIIKVNFKKERLINLIAKVLEREATEERKAEKAKKEEQEYHYIEKAIDRRIYKVIEKYPENWLNKRWIRIDGDDLFSIPAPTPQGNIKMIYPRIKDVKRYCKENHHKFKCKVLVDSDGIYNVVFFIRILPYNIYW